TPLPTAPSGVSPSSGVPSGTGVTLTPTDVTSTPIGTGLDSTAPTAPPTSIPTSGLTSIPTSESTASTETSNSVSTATIDPSSGITVSGSSGTDTLPTSSSLSSAGNATASGVPTTSPAVTPSTTIAPTPTPSSTTIEIPFSVPSDFNSRPQSVLPTATDDATSLVVGTSIIMEPSTVPSPTATSSGIPSNLPKLIQPPNGLPSSVPANMFLGQIGFKWQLNWNFVLSHDSGNQIFEYLPKAIIDGLNISSSELVMQGLKPLDTTQFQGFITTLAMFWIPNDLSSTLQAQLLNPADAFWHNENQTVNDLTELINTAIPLSGGPTDSGDPTQSGDASPNPTGGSENGGVIGGDMSASHNVNPKSAGIATGAVMGAIAYGAAMFFVARRYRNKRLSHQRSSSVASGSRYTYGSMTGGAFMSGGRGPGRSTPGGAGSRGSRGSSSSNGRSVRTQQISAPVMAENSLGWN
ncbi:hypothetical protein CC78DRAFT_472260, partial [Lojkania enalia]